MSTSPTISPVGSKKTLAEVEASMVMPISLEECNVRIKAVRKLLHKHEQEFEQFLTLRTETGSCYISRSELAEYRDKRQELRDQFDVLDRWRMAQTKDGGVDETKLTGIIATLRKNLDDKRKEVNGARAAQSVLNDLKKAIHTVGVPKDAHKVIENLTEILLSERQARRDDVDAMRQGYQSHICAIIYMLRGMEKRTVIQDRLLRQTEQYVRPGYYEVWLRDHFKAWLIQEPTQDDYQNTAEVK